MAGDGPDRPVSLLRRVASLLIRGPDARYILDDLDELFARDLGRGMSYGRAGRRYLRNLVGSALSTRRARRTRRAPIVSWLDVALGVRMLGKHPGLALVGTLAMAVGIDLGAGYVEAVGDFLHPTVPLEDGDRLVGIRWVDLETGLPERRSLHDFVQWRGSLASVEALGAFRTVERNLIIGGAPAEPEVGAQITAPAFRLAGRRAALGRTLSESDEPATAAPVVVIGHRVWRNRFGGDRDVVGRTVRLGDSRRTVVGVMPEGFGFPVNHDFWIPLRPGAAPEPRAGPAIEIFGRLAPGATLEDARTELAARGLRAAADHPETHERLRARVMPYTHLFFGGGGSGAGVYLVESLFVLILAVICVNVATLVFARTATRTGEIAIRHALGASRARIVAQLFVEALVLASLAAVVGLFVVQWTLRTVMGRFWAAMGGRPFWWSDALAPRTVLWAAGLALVAAALVGVVPALKATGGGIAQRMRSAATRGASLRLGRLWSAMLVGQIAFSVALLPPAVALVRSWIGTEAAGLGFPAGQYLGIRLETDRRAGAVTGMGLVDPAAASASPSRFRETVRELERRLAADPRVLGVTSADRFPGMNHEARPVEVEDPSGRAATGTRSDGPDGNAPTREAQVAAVDADFFDVLDAAMLSGRGFRPAELQGGSGVAVVNRAFVRQVLGDRNAVGRRVRFAPHGADGEPGPWHEIVGVAEDLATDRDGLGAGMRPAIYLPLVPQALAAGDVWSVRTALHLRDDPAGFAPEVRRVATSIDPTLRLYDVLPLDRPLARTSAIQRINQVIVQGVLVVAVLALLISAAGTYSLMSFTVARRTREIGIRAALGADPRRLLASIFARALRQVGVGAVLGALALVVGVVALAGSEGSGTGGAPGGALEVLLPVCVLIASVASVACGIPALRALRIEPTEALAKE